MAQATKIMNTTTDSPVWNFLLTYWRWIATVMLGIVALYFLFTYLIPIIAFVGLTFVIYLLHRKRIMEKMAQLKKS